MEEMRLPDAQGRLPIGHAVAIINDLINNYQNTLWGRAGAGRAWPLILKFLPQTRESLVVSRPTFQRACRACDNRCIVCDIWRECTCRLCIGG